MDLKLLASDPAEFQDQIFLPTGTGPRRLGAIAAKFQRRRFSIVNPSLLAVSRQEKPPVPRVWDERTKGASKDSDWSVNLLWLLTFSRHPIRIQCGAYDREQASEVLLIIRDILRIDKPVNKFLRQVIQIKQNLIVNRRTGAQCEILTSDKLGSHGARPDVVLINELTHQTSPDFAETLLDNLDKMPNGFGVICTNSGHDPSWQLKWKTLFAETPQRWKTLQYRGKPPWLPAKAWEEAERRNTPNRFRRLFEGQWTGDTEGALDHLDIDACITQLEPMTGTERGWVFVAGLDVGLKKHSTGLVVLARHVGYHEDFPVDVQRSDLVNSMIDVGLMEEPEKKYRTEYEEGTGRLRLAYSQCWKPGRGKRVSLEAVKTKILELDRRFRLQGISVDPYQAEHIAELLEKENVPVIRSFQTSTSLQEQATATIEAFQQRTIDLFNDEDLIADLKRLQTKDSGLRIRLISPEYDGEGPGTGHGDLASGLSLALHLGSNTTHLLAHSAPSSIIAC